MADADDIETDDEFQLDKEPKSSRGWLAMIAHAEKEFRSYQDKCDSIDKLYANLERLASNTRDREFAMFWANIQVLGPSIYSRPPVPVIVPRFKDQDRLRRVSAEFLERAVVVSFEREDLDDIMKAVRDDLVVSARGVPWVRYEAKSEGDKRDERVCIEHADRKDFLHDPARKWKEVDWVAKRSWLTKKEMRKRFRKHSGEVYKAAAYAIRNDDDGTNDGTSKAGVWEVWSKSQNRVVWVSEGCDKLLDDDKPHLKLDGFFPCPRPAYGTTQRRSLLPVPDFVFYKDQLEEINELTSRIAALSEAVKVRGFYPAGAGEIGDAIEAAVKSQADNMILYPVSNWSLLGGTGAKDMIVWLPLADIASAVTQMVTLRRQLIDDVYQITGLSDIMRGATNASETLGAQQLKSQYGSIRIRDRQDELTRIARDLTRITAEIMAEEFSKDTLLDMAQMNVPTDADIAKQVKGLETQLKDLEKQARVAQESPEVQAMAQQNPEEAQAALQELQQQADAIGQQIAALQEEVTLEKIVKFLKDERIRPFVLDIETDSTIAPDENAQKQRATEYLTAIGGLLAQAVPAIQQMPQIAPLMADTIKFAQQQFRVGRQMDQTVEEFTDAMKALAQQPAPDPNAGAQAAAQAEAERGQRELALKEQEAQLTNAERQQALQEKQNASTIEAQKKEQLALLEIDTARAKAEQSTLEHTQRLDIGNLTITKLKTEIAAKRAGMNAAAAAADDEAITALEGADPAVDAEIDSLAPPSLAQALTAQAQALTGLVAQLSAPKRIVRDPITGQVSGVEPVVTPDVQV